MRLTTSPSPSTLAASIKALCRRLLRRATQRRVICVSVAFNLLLWPGLGAVTRDFLGFAFDISNVVDVRLLSSSYEAYFIKRLLSRSAQTPRHDTPADRVAAVAQLKISPGRRRQRNRAIVCQA